VLLLIHGVGYWLYGVHKRQVAGLHLYTEGREFWRAGDLDRAAQRFRTFAENRAAIAAPVPLNKEFPSAATAWFMLATVESARGHQPAALEAYERAHALDPTRGRREIRDLLLEAGRYAEVEQRARRDLRRDSGDAAAYWDLAAARLGQQDYAAAARIYDDAQRVLPQWLRQNALLPAEQRPDELTPQEADTLNLASVAWLRAGDPGKAHARCDEVSRRQLSRDPRDQLCRAALAEQAGDLAAARAALRSFVPAAPEHDWLEADLRIRLEQHER
jgi:tetratricopeptide (TPR) repeat protein